MAALIFDGEARIGEDVIAPANERRPWGIGRRQVVICVPSALLRMALCRRAPRLCYDVAHRGVDLPAVFLCNMMNSMADDGIVRALNNEILVQKAGWARPQSRQLSLS